MHLEYCYANNCYAYSSCYSISLIHLYWNYPNFSYYHIISVITHPNTSSLVLSWASFSFCPDYPECVSMKSGSTHACSHNFSLNVSLQRAFPSWPCDKVRYRFLTWSCWTPIFHQTLNLTCFTEAEVKLDSSSLGPPIIFFRLTCCWLTWNCSEPEQNMKGAVETARRCCRPRHCFWCVNPVTLMPKHFCSSDSAQRVTAALTSQRLTGNVWLNITP